MPGPDPFKKMVELSGVATVTTLPPNSFNKQGGLVYHDRTPEADLTTAKRAIMGMAIEASPVLLGTLANVISRDARYGTLVKNALGDAPYIIGSTVVNGEARVINQRYNNAVALDANTAQIQINKDYDQYYRDRQKQNESGLTPAMIDYYKTCMALGRHVSYEEYVGGTGVDENGAKTKFDGINPAARKQISSLECLDVVNIYARKDLGVLENIEKQRILVQNAEIEAAKGASAQLSEVQLGALTRKAQQDYNQFANDYRASSGAYTPAVQGSYKVLIDDYQKIAAGSVNREVHGVKGNALVMHANDEMDFNQFLNFIGDREGAGGRENFQRLRGTGVAPGSPTPTPSTQVAPTPASPAASTPSPASATSPLTPAPTTTAPSPSTPAVTPPSSTATSPSGADYKLEIAKRDGAIIAALYQAKDEKAAYAVLGAAVRQDCIDINKATGERRMLNPNKPDASNIAQSYDFQEFLGNHPNIKDQITHHPKFQGGLSESEYYSSVIGAAKAQLAAGAAKAVPSAPAKNSGSAIDQVKSDLAAEMQGGSGPAHDRAVVGMLTTLMNDQLQKNPQMSREDVYKLSKQFPDQAIQKFNAAYDIPAGIDQKLYMQALEQFHNAPQKGRGPDPKSHSYNDRSNLSEDAMNAVDRFVANDKPVLSGLRLPDIEADGGRRATLKEDALAVAANLKAPIETTTLTQMEAKGAKGTGVSTGGKEAYLA